MNIDFCINTKNLLLQGLASSAVSFYNRVSAEGMFAGALEYGTMGRKTNEK